MEREVYLDNNATTKPDAEVIEAVRYYLEEEYGNASSVHHKGVAAERAIDKHREAICDIFGIKPREFVFTSGGTESNNTILKGVADSRRKEGRHIVTSALEHSSVLNVGEQLSGRGFDVTYVKPDEHGMINAERIEEALTGDTILVSVMHVNNETGAIFPVEKIGARVKAYDDSIFMHVDGVQAFGKLPVSLEHIDAYALSGHKIHAPKGIGGFYIDESTFSRPLIVGGGQEHGQRSGTENVPGIAGLGTAARLMVESRNEVHQKLKDCKKYFLEGLSKFNSVVINSPEQSLPGTINVSFPPIPAEVIVNALSEKGIYVSSGSACSSKSRSGSHVLSAMGLSQKRMDSSIRFSLSRYNDKNDMRYTLETLNEIMPRLRKIANIQQA